MGNLILLVFLLSITLFLNYGICKRDILAPPVIMTGMFLISSVFALINCMEWSIDYSFNATMIIWTGIVVFCLPFYVVFIHRSRKDTNILVYNFSVIPLESWKIIITILIDAFLLVLYYRAIHSLVRNSGYTGTHVQLYFRNVTGYEGTESIGSLLKQLVKIIDASAYIFTYIFINNVLLNKERYLKNLLLLIPSIMFVIKAFMSGGRQDMLRVFSFFVIVTYYMTKQKTNWRKNISFRFLGIIIASFTIALPLFYYTLQLAGRSTTRTMFQMISTYIGGPIQHFNQYLQDPVERVFIGEESLTPVLNILSSLGIIDFHSTIHLEARRLGITHGNVYSFFRRPLHDFGMMGMYAFVILISLFFVYMYFTKVRYRNQSTRSELDLIIYGYFMYWIVLSSIDQLSMSYISLYTLVTLILIYFMWRVYVTVRIKKGRISIKKLSK